MQASSRVASREHGDINHNTGTSLVVQWLRIHLPGFPGGEVVENLPANAGDTGSSPGLGRSHIPRSS